jgi:hypothetical protein
MIIKLFLAFIFSFGTVSSLEESNISLSSPQSTTVYICYSETAKKFHYRKTCRGLNACTHEIKQVSITDAKVKYNRTLCGWED